MKLEKVILNLRQGDRDFLKTYIPGVPYGVVIRTIVAAYVDKVRAETEIQTSTQRSLGDVDLSGIDIKPEEDKHDSE